ncbi:MAG: thiolase family protein [Thermoanaerobaculia bacterium]|nr:thiolase family protein [Thermoanaerobaculia bacterium]
MLREPVAIVHPRRLAVGKLAGVLARFEAYELLGALFRSVMKETRRETVDDVIGGNVRNSVGNVTRVAALEAGISVEVPAMTVDRQCASGLEALVIAASKINAGIADSVLVGGVESASRCPWFMEKTARAYSYAEPRPYPIRLSTLEIGDPPMGETAEILADEYQIDRGEMDEFAAESHHRAAEAGKSGAFDDEIVPLEIPQRKGEPLQHATDETVRGDTTVDALGRLPSVFRKDGRVTAGNSSPLTDGAAACLVVSKRELDRTGVRPAGWLTGVSTIGLDPNRMGLGPVRAIRDLLDSAELSQDDVDLFEINEAFAAQILAVNEELEIPSDKLNVRGGAIALGHPLGASGTRLVVTMAHLLGQRRLRRGVVSLCVGGGQGVAALIEAEID